MIHQDAHRFLLAGVSVSRDENSFSASQARDLHTFFHVYTMKAASSEKIIFLFSPMTPHFGLELLGSILLLLLASLFVWTKCETNH